MISFFNRIKQSRLAEFVLLIINSYLLGLLSWQVVHKQADITVFWLYNIEPTINNPLLSVKFFLVIFIILALIGFFIKSIINHDKSNIKLQLWILGSLILGINLQDFVNNIPLFNISVFGLTAKMFFAETWFWQNLIFVFTSCYFLVFYYVTPLRKRFQIQLKNNLWIYLLIGFAIILYSLMTIGRHQNLGSFTMDLGGYDQTIWNFSQFQAPLTSVYADRIANGEVDLTQYNKESIKQFFPNIMSDHFEPIMALISPIFWIWNDVRMLLFFQVLIVCMGAWPIYMLAREKLKSNFASLCLAASYLFFIGIQIALEFDFHPLVLIAPLLAFLFYFLEQKKYIGLYITCVLILLCKEVASLYIFFFGLYVLLIRKEYKHGLILLGLGIFWYILVIDLIIPLGFGRAYGHISAYSNLGNNALGVLKTLITNPLYAVNTLFEPIGKMTSWLAIFGSTGFLAFLSPATLIVALPMLGEKFLTANKESLWVMWWHYTATITPIIIISAMYGIRWMRNKFPKVNFNWTIFGGIVVIISTLSVAFLFYNSKPFQVPLAKIFSKKFYESRQDIADFYEIKKIIPEDVSVATQDSLLPHLAHRTEIYRIHPSVPKADYIVINTYDGYWPWSKEDITRIADELREDPDYTLEKNINDVYLFKKNN